MRVSVLSNLQRALAKVLGRRIRSKLRNGFSFSIQDLRENAFDHGFRFVSRTSASSFDAARPLSMLSQASPTAYRRSGATPARQSAAAALMMTRSRAALVVFVVSPCKI